LSNLAVGPDGRNRCLLSAFRARTGRNQPSNSKFMFGPATWLRGLIRPQTGYGIAYIDWSQQEFGIAAALSGDPMMLDAYQSGDPYLAFAKQAGAVPEDATKDSHSTERNQFKACVLAVQYGMGEDSLAMRIGQPVLRARELLKLHRTTYRVFWEWSDAALDHAMLHGTLWTVFGWTIHVDDKPNPRSLRNFPMQANGAEMLRLACCLAVERGIRVCAPVHDALLIEAPLNSLDNAIAATRAAMAEASAIVLSGFRLNTDVEAFRYPARYRDKRGTTMWETVWKIIEDLEAPDTNEDLVT
jgi:DNA polymerase I-like protein with 3'-5' exonuclease and polymerase domains